MTPTVFLSSGLPARDHVHAFSSVRKLIRRTVRSLEPRRLRATSLEAVTRVTSRYPAVRRLLLRPVSCLSGDEIIQESDYEKLANAVATGLRGTNVYLIGMMGSGKSTVGSVLASRLKYAFLDTDQVVEQAAGCTVAHIFESEGEESFRNVETSTLQDLHQYKNLVVGTGGGIVNRSMNWSYLQQGIVIYLNGSPKKLARRMAQGDLAARPLLFEGLEDKTMAVQVATEKMESILLEREKLYRCADIEVSLEDSVSESGLASVDEVVLRILTELQKKMEEATKEREAKSNYKIHGLKDVDGEASSINTSATSAKPEGFA